MLEVVSFIVLVGAFIFGHSKPVPAMWFVAVTYPLLYPSNFPIVSSDILFLNISRLSTAIVLGAHLRKARSVHLGKLLESSFVRAYLSFAIGLFVISVGDMTQYYTFSFLPEVYISLTLGYFLIRKDKDFERLLGILVAQGVVFVLVIFLDFFDVVNIYLMIAKNVPNFTMDSIYDDEFSRAGIKRVAGMDGNAINSAVRLVILFPLALLHIKLNKKRRSYFFAIFMFLGIVVLMSRAAYISLLFALVFIVFQLVRFKRHVLSRIIYLMKYFMGFVVSFGLLYVMFPFFNNIVTKLYKFSFEASTVENLSQRTIVYPLVLKLFKNDLFLGQFRSPLYVYEEIMGGHDLPLPMIYAISGGIILLLLFLNWWIRLPLYFVGKINFVSRIDNLKLTWILVSSAFVGGIVPMLSNWVDTSVSLLLILFTATYKYSILNEAEPDSININ